MDTILENKSKFTPKRIGIGIAIIVVFSLISYGFWGSNSSTFKVAKDNVTIASVSYGDFNDYISIGGTVKPITTVFLDAYEGGRVKEIKIEEGGMLKKGDVILTLENQSLYEEILSSENNLATKQNNLRDTRIKFESNKIIGQKNTLEAQYRFVQAKRKHEQYSKLYKEELIAKEDYLQTKENFELTKKQLDITLFQNKQDSLLQSTGIKDLDNDLLRMKKTLNLVYDRINQLEVKSPIDGQLGFLDVQIGQQINRGKQIGQINVLSNYKIESEVSEFYLDRVKRGLTGTFERNGKIYRLKLKKIYPEVRNNTFKIDLIFDGERPKNITTGQSYYIKLQLGNATKTTLLPKGVFFQNTGGQWVYVLDASGKIAIKRNVKIGKQNPDYYEILEGLQKDEKVIISSYDSFGGNEQLILK
jgi:HlyD family secretion protein